MRPTVVTVLAVLHLIAGSLLVLSGLGGAALGLNDYPIAASVLGLGLLTYGVAHLACGTGLWLLKPYGRFLEIAISCLGLLGFPVGTAISVLILIYMFRPGVKVLFSGRPEAEWTAAERQSVTSDAQGSLTTVIVILVAILGSVVAVGIVAAIAIPGFLRARMSANEAGAVGAMRAVVSAQTTFATTCGNGAYASSLESLGKPPEGKDQSFLNPGLTRDPASIDGYHVTLTPGEDAGVACNGTRATRGFFVVAEPDTPDATGRHYFATNADGTIFQSLEPIPVALSGTPPGALPLQGD
jgi:type II secretory pathway pseudopilin PulG